MSVRLLCLGYGYTATVFAAHWSPAQCAGTRRSPSSNDGAMEIVAFNGAVLEAGLARLLETATHVLVSIPPDAQGCPAARLAGPVLAASHHVQWVTYLSATSVYGDRAGGWCFETTPTAPTSARGRARLQAERDWAQLGLPLHVFRLPGIYGPGRSVFERMQAGTARRILKPGAIFNRVHVADIAEALTRSAQRPTPGAVFNLADDAPSPPEDPILYAAQLAGWAPPPEISIDSPDVSSMARSFYGEPKRVANAAVKAALGWRPRYPTYREGLASIWASLSETA